MNPSQPTQRTALVYSLVANPRLASNPRLVALVQGVWRKLKYVSLVLLVHAYLLMAVYTHGWDTTWCSGTKFATAVVLFVDAVMLHTLSVEGNFFDRIVDGIKRRRIKVPGSFTIGDVKKIFWGVLVACMTSYILLDSSGSARRLTSFGGVCLCILVGYACSKHRKEIPWPTVLAAVLMQFLCGLLVTRWMRSTFECFGFRAQMAINSTFRGSSFIFGYLDNGQYVGLPRQQPVFAFHHLPVVLFFSFLVSVLHYLGATQFVAVNFGKMLHMATRISAPECIFSMATIVVNLPMAVAFIKPFMTEMTLSELHCIMAAGFCGLRVAILAMIVNLGSHEHHLLTANLMTVPAGLGMAKLLLPETEKAPLASATPRPLVSSENTVFEAGSNGVIAALPAVMQILVTVIVYYAFLALMDAVLASLLLALGFTVRLEELLGTLFAPLSFAMGLTGGDAVHVGYLLAVRTFGTEVLAFLELNKLSRKKTISRRSAVVATYALCSSSSLGQMPAVASVFTNMAPRRSADIQGVRWRALFTGCLSTYLNACIAGCLVRE